jgi:hypothetical protein
MPVKSLTSTEILFFYLNFNLIFLRFSKIDVLLTEHDDINWFHSHVFTNHNELKSK